MKTTLIAGVSTLALSTAAFAGGHGMSGADIQAALDAAAATDTASVVTIPGDVALDATLTYTGTAPLTLAGAGVTVSIASDATVFTVPNGADVAISGITFQGPGGFDIKNQGDYSKGIFVGVPTDRTGTVSLTLTDVTVAGVSGHGIHVSDCSLADACGGGSGGSGDGSAASIAVSLNGVTVDNAGNGKFDADGLRVDERGAGDITFHAVGSMFKNVGADGVELDEGQDGDVIVAITNTIFKDNGNYCDPAVMDAFLPTPDEGEFEEGKQPEAGIPGPVTGSPDDTCIEREVDLYDDGTVEEFAFGLDLDDGFDIDEAGNGSIVANITSSAVMGNLDEGFDFDEEDAGDIRLTIAGASATSNKDDGFKNSEEGEGGVFVTVTDTGASDNGGKGMVFEEEDAGDVVVMVAGVATNNAIFSIKIRNKGDVDHVFSPKPS